MQLAVVSIEMVRDSVSRDHAAQWSGVDGEKQRTICLTSERTDKVTFGRQDHRLHPCPRMKHVWWSALRKGIFWIMTGGLTQLKCAHVFWKNEPWVMKTHFSMCVSPFFGGHHISVAVLVAQPEPIELEQEVPYSTIVFCRFVRYKQKSAATNACVENGQIIRSQTISVRLSDKRR